MRSSEQRYVKKVQKIIDYKNARYYPNSIMKMKSKIRELKMSHIRNAIFISILGGVPPILFSIAYFLHWFWYEWEFIDNFIVGVPFLIGIGMCVYAYIRYRKKWRDSVYLEDVNYLQSLIFEYNKEKNK